MIQPEVEVLTVLYRTARTLRANPMRPEIAGAASKFEIELADRLRSLGVDPIAATDRRRRGQQPAAQAA